MKDSRRSFYLKLVSIITILSTIPVIVVGIFSYLKSAETIQYNIAKEKVQSVYQIQENFEQILKMVDVSVTNFVMSYQLISTLDEPMEVSQFQLYQQIKKEMTQIQQFESGIEDLLLVSLNKNWGINNKGLKRLDEHDIDEITNRYYSSDHKSYWMLEKKSNLFFDSASENCQHYLSLIKLLPLINIQKEGISVAYLPVCNFNDILQSSESEIIMVLDEHYNVISHSRFNHIGENFSDKPFIKKINSVSENQSQFNISQNDSDFKVTYRKSPYNNWTYISMIQLSELNKQSRAIGWFTFIICTIMLIGILIFSFLSSRRLYAPINRLISVISNSLSNISHNDKVTDEFSIIEKQINYIIAQNDQLETKLRGQIAPLKQFFITRLLQGNVEEQELFNKLITYNYNQDWKQFVVLTIQIDSLKEENYQEDHKDLLLFTINTMIEEIIPSQNRLTPIVIDKEQVTIYLNNEEKYSKYTETITSLANTIQRKIKKELNLSISIGFSKPYENLMLAANAYKESKEALRYTLKFGEGSIIFFENLQRESSFYTSYPRKTENQLFDAIKLGYKKEVDFYLNKLIQSLFDGQLSHTQYELSIVRFFTNVIELSETLGVNVLEFNEHRSLFAQLYEFKTLSEVANWFKYKIIYPLMERLEERSQSKYKNISDEMIHIIQQEFDSDLTLNYIADKLHYNSNYLSSIFSKETNTSFTEYLTLVRINKAKEWLIKTDMTVNEIAKRLNYNNSQNFIRSFKKVEGKTPGQYREEKGNPS